MNTDSITIAHDYFTQRGGAERVAAALINELHPLRVITAIHDPESSFAIDEATIIETSFLQRVAAFRRDPRRALPAFPAAWSLFGRVNDGTVLCSSSGWSHAVKTGPNARKVVYCHNPARWLYQPEDYFKDQPARVRRSMAILRPILVRWDRAAAATADIYIANSTAVAERIKMTYGRDAEVIHPPVSIDVSGDRQPVSGIRSGFFLTVGRGRGYKNVDLLLGAFDAMPSERLVIVGTPPTGVRVPSNATFISNISDAELRWLYANARALVSVSHEDFGLTPLEANAFGTPALTIREGGFLDSIAEGVSGSFIDTPTPSGIADAVRTFPVEWDHGLILKHADKFSMTSFVRRLREVIERLPSPSQHSLHDTNSS